MFELEEIWGAQGCLNPSSVCIYSTQKDMCDVMLAFLCSWLPLNSSATNVAGVWSSKACPLSSLIFGIFVGLLTQTFTLQKLGFIFGITFVFLYLTPKGSGLMKGVIPPLQTLLACCWSPSQHCRQNLFLTDSSPFAQNVIPALITPGLDHCRSFMVILNLFLLNFRLAD